MAINQASETGVSTIRSMETSKLMVRQPAKLAELSKLLETFDNLSARVSERSSAGPAQDWSSGGGGQTGGATQGDDGTSARDTAIAKIPSPVVVRQQLERHIAEQVRTLEREARKAAASGKPGSAYRVNEFYARIRKLQSLVWTMVEATEDLLRRLFIRVFIDKQPIL